MTMKNGCLGGGIRQWAKQRKEENVEEGKEGDGMAAGGGN